MYSVQPVYKTADFMHTLMGIDSVSVIDVVVISTINTERLRVLFDFKMCWK